MDGLVALSAEFSDGSLPLDELDRPLCMGTGSVIGYAREGELNVATDLYGVMLDTWVRATDKDGRLPQAYAMLAQRLAEADRLDEAIARCEQAWEMGFADQNVANRHSLILERQKRNAEAIEVAERGLALPDLDFIPSRWRSESCAAASASGSNAPISGGSRTLRSAPSNRRWGTH